MLLARVTRSGVVVMGLTAAPEAAAGLGRFEPRDVLPGMSFSVTPVRCRETAPRSWTGSWGAPGVFDVRHDVEVLDVVAGREASGGLLSVDLSVGFVDPVTGTVWPLNVREVEHPRSLTLYVDVRAWPDTHVMVVEPDDELVVVVYARLRDGSSRFVRLGSTALTTCSRWRLRWAEVGSAGQASWVSEVLPSVAAATRAD